MEQRHDSDHMSIVFSTYHSIDVINKAQKQHDLEEFDLIICDEAHRTTGATFDGDDDSNGRGYAGWPGDTPPNAPQPEDAGASGICVRLPDAPSTLGAWMPTS